MPAFKNREDKSASENAVNSTCKLIDDCPIRKKHRTEGNRKEKQVQSIRTGNT